MSKDTFYCYGCNEWRVKEGRVRKNRYRYNCQSCAQEAIERERKKLEPSEGNV